MSSAEGPGSQKRTRGNEYDATMAKIASSFSSLYKSHYGGAPTGGTKEEQAKQQPREYTTQRPPNSINSGAPASGKTQQTHQPDDQISSSSLNTHTREIPPLPLSGEWDTTQRASSPTLETEQTTIGSDRPNGLSYATNNGRSIRGSADTRYNGQVSGGDERQMRWSTSYGPQNLAQRALERRKSDSEETQTPAKQKSWSASSLRGSQSKKGRRQRIGSSRAGGLEKYSSEATSNVEAAPSSAQSQHEAKKASSSIEKMVSSAENVVATARGLSSSVGFSGDRHPGENEDRVRSSTTSIATTSARNIPTLSISRNHNENNRTKDAVQQWSMLRAQSSRELSYPTRSNQSNRQTPIRSPSSSSSLTHSAKMEAPQSRRTSNFDEGSKLRVLIPVKETRSWRESLIKRFGPRAQASFAVSMTSKILANAIEQATSSLRDAVEEDYGPRFAERVAAMKGYQYRISVKEVLMSVSLAFGVFDYPLLTYLKESCSRFLQKHENAVATTLNFDRSSSTVNALSSPSSSISEPVVGDILLEHYEEFGLEKTAIVTPQHAYLPQPLVEIIAEEGLELVRIDELGPARVSWFGPDDIYGNAEKSEGPSFYLNCLPEAIASRLTSKLSLNDFVETIAEASDQLASSVETSGGFGPEIPHRIRRQGYDDSGLTMNDHYELWLPTTSESKAMRAGSSLQISTEVMQKYSLDVTSFLSQRRSFHLPTCPPTWKMLMSEYTSRMMVKHIGDKRKCWDALQRFVVISRRLASRSDELRSFRIRSSGRSILEAWLQLLTAKRYHKKRITGKFLPMWKDAAKTAKREQHLYSLAVEHANEVLLRKTLREWGILVSEEKHEYRARYTADLFYENHILKKCFDKWNGILERTRNIHALNSKAQQRVLCESIRYWQHLIASRQRNRLASVAAHDWYYLRLAIRSFRRIQDYCKEQRNSRKAEALQRFHLQRSGIDHWRFSVRWKKRARNACYRLIEIRSNSELRVAYHTWLDLTCKLRRLQYALSRRAAVMKYQVFQAFWDYRLKRIKRRQYKQYSDSHFDRLCKQKAFSWWLDMYRDRQTLLAVEEYYRVRLQRKCWSTWRAAVDQILRMRKLKLEADKRRQETLLKQHFRIWSNAIYEKQVEEALDAAANAHRSLSLSRRMWKQWSAVVRASRERQEKAEKLKNYHDRQLCKKYFGLLKSETFLMVEDADLYRASLQAHSALRRWMKYTHNRLVRNEAAQLAQLQYRSVLVRKLFQAWDQGVVLSKAERQMQEEVMQWYRKKLTKHAFDKWKAAAAGGLLRTIDEDEQDEAEDQRLHSGQRLSTPSSTSSSPSSLQAPVVVNERGQYVDSEAHRPVAIALGRSGKTVSAAFSTRAAFSYNNGDGGSKQDFQNESSNDTTGYSKDAPLLSDHSTGNVNQPEHRRARIVEARQKYAERSRNLARKYAAGSAKMSSGQARQSENDTRKASGRALSRGAHPLPSLDHIVSNSAPKK